MVTAAAALVLALVLTLLLALAGARPATASWGEATVEPTGRGLQLLGEREAILLEQSGRLERAGRARARSLYRLLRLAAAERPGAGDLSAEDLSAATAAGGEAGILREAGRRQARPGGRPVALATLALQRDLGEARLLRAELDRVRGEQADPLAGVGARVMTGSGPLPTASLPRRYLRPVPGALVAPFGVDRDPTTGAWVFRAAVSFLARPTEPVRSPVSGRVVRVAPSIAGGGAVVLSHKRGRWTTVVSGLCRIMVGRPRMVRAGELIGEGGCASRSTVRLETWRDRDPVDPASLLRDP